MPRWEIIDSVSIFDSNNIITVTTNNGYKHKKAFLVKEQTYVRNGQTYTMTYNLTMEPGDFLAFQGVNVAFRTATEPADDKDILQDGTTRTPEGRHYIYAEIARLDFIDLPFVCVTTDEGVNTTFTHNQENINVVGLYLFISSIKKEIQIKYI